MVWKKLWETTDPNYAKKWSKKFGPNTQLKMSKAIPNRGVWIGDKLTPVYWILTRKKR